MSALAEALLAAQRQASTAAVRAFVAGSLNESDLLEILDNIGETDKTEQGYLLAALHVEKQLGVVPQTNGAVPRPAALDEPATQAQLNLVAKLADDKGRVVRTDGMTKAQASQAIEALKADRAVTF